MPKKVPHQTARRPGATRRRAAPPAAGPRKGRSWWALPAFPWLLMGLLWAASGCRPQASFPSLQVGAALVEITPPPGFPHYRGELAGQPTPGTGTGNPLYARALVFKQGARRAALLVCDLNAIPRDVIRIVRKRAAGQTGIPFQHISVAATHTHTAPAIRELVPGFADREAAGLLTADDRQGYLYQLIQGMTQALVQASRQARPADLIAGRGRAEGISFNRRFLMTDGRVRFNPGRQNPGIVGPVGPVDPTVHFVLFRNPAREAVEASLTVFANHADTEGGTTFSADYPAYLHQQLKSMYGRQLVSVFGAGPCGDINHIDLSQPAPATGRQPVTRHIGLQLAAAIKRAGAGKEPTPAHLQVASKTLLLPLQDFTAAELRWALQDTSRLYQERPFLNVMRRRKILSLEQLRQREAIPPAVSGQPWLLPVEIQILQLDNQTAIVTLPGEVFSRLGLDLKKRSPFANTLVIELANADIRYVPTRRAFAEGDYEPINSRLAPGSGERLVNEAVGMLQALARAPGQQQ